MYKPHPSVFKLSLGNGLYFNLFFILLFWNSDLSAQPLLKTEISRIDSVKQLLKKTMNDRQRDTLFDVLEKTYESASLRNRYGARFDWAEKNLRDAMKTALEARHYKSYSSFLNNLGLLYKESGRTDEAIEMYIHAMKRLDKLNAEQNKGFLLNNLASLYYDDQQFDKAFEYFRKAIKYRILNKDPYVGDAYWNIAFLYLQQKDTSSYLKNIEEAGKYYLQMGGDYGMGSYYFTQGAIHMQNKNYIDAENCFLKVLPHYRKLNFIEFISWAQFCVARADYRMNKMRLAELYADSSLALAQKINSTERIKNAAELLYTIHAKKGGENKALTYFKIFIAARDSILNTSNSRSLIRSEYRYQYEKQSAIDSLAHVKEKQIKQAEINQHKAELSAKRMQQYFLFGGLALVLIFAIVMYNRFKITNRQKKIIEEQKFEVEKKKEEVEHQKDLIEEKNKEITDSINYAKRIQEAILPSRYSLVENLKNGFVLYKPKDIVAGDFYWLEKQDNKIFFAAADCTGHGVPGAMVSVVCSNALSKSLLEEGIVETGKLLDRTRELVIQRFSKSGEEVKDGMDISLCCLENNRLQWSGANNPLWMVRYGENEITEIKPDKQPIGKYADAKPFTTHNFELNKGDTLYIFTDGYEDQFGGEKGKKFKASKMKELFQSIQQLSMDEQKEKINTTFENWRGELEQVDDVCIIGIRI